MSVPERFVIVVEASTDARPGSPLVQLRKLLKTLLRRHEFKCISLRPERPEDATTPKDSNP